MMYFYLAAGAVALACIAIMLPGLLRPRRMVSVDMEAENIAVARDRMAELGEAGSSASAESPEVQAALLEDLSGPDYRLQENPGRGRWSALALLIAAPLVAAVIYGQLGDSRWTDAPSSAPSLAGDAHSTPDIPALLARLEQSLVENPGNADGWAIAGRTYMVMNDFAKAETAYARVHELVGDDPDILTAWADASLMRNGGQYTAEIADRIARALALDPVQVNALWIGAIGASSQGDAATADAYAERLRPLLAGNPDALTQLTTQIRASAPAPSASGVTDGEPAATPSDGTTQEQAASGDAAGDAAIEVRVTMAPELEQGLDPDATVFVFARALQGPPMPLAAKKLSVADLPLDLVLDDSQAMMAGMNLSSRERVLVTARVSLSGSPGAQPGDPTSDSVESPTRGGPMIDLVIDRLAN